MAGANVNLQFLVTFKDQVTANMQRIGVSMRQLAVQAAAAREAMENVANTNTRVASSLGQITTRFDPLQKAMTLSARLARDFGAALIGIGVGVGLGNILDKIVDFGDKMSTVKAVTGASAAEFEELRTVALDAGNATRYTANQAAAAMETLGRAGLNAQQSIAALGPTLNLAAAGNIDLDDSAKLILTTLKQYGQGMEGATHLADLLAFTDANTTTSVQELSEAFKAAGPFASLFGVSLEETSAALGALAQQGRSGGLAGTGLSRVIQQLNTATPKLNKFLKDTGLTLDDISTKKHGLDEVLETLTKANALSHGTDLSAAFGFRGGPTITALLKQMQTFRDQMAGANTDANGFAQKMADTMNDNIGGAIRRVQAAFSSFVLSFNADRTGPIRDFGEMFALVIRYLSEGEVSFRNIGAAATYFGKSAEDLEKQVRGIVEAIQFLAKMVEVAAVFFAVTTAVGLMEGALAALLTPVGAVALAIAVVAANWDTFVTAFEATGLLAVAQGLFSALAAVVRFLASNFGLLTAALIGFGAAWATYEILLVVESFITGGQVMVGVVGALTRAFTLLRTALILTGLALDIAGPIIAIAAAVGILTFAFIANASASAKHVEKINEETASYVEARRQVEALTEAHKSLAAQTAAGQRDAGFQAKSQFNLAFQDEQRQQATVDDLKNKLADAENSPDASGTGSSISFIVDQLKDAEQRLKNAKQAQLDWKKVADDHFETAKKISDNMINAARQVKEVAANDPQTVKDTFADRLQKQLLEIQARTKALGQDKETQQLWSETAKLGIDMTQQYAVGTEKYNAILKIKAALANQDLVQRQLDLAIMGSEINANNERLRIAQLNNSEAAVANALLNEKLKILKEHPELQGNLISAGIFMATDKEEKPRADAIANKASSDQDVKTNTADIQAFNTDKISLQVLQQKAAMVGELSKAQAEHNAILEEYVRVAKEQGITDLSQVTLDDERIAQVTRLADAQFDLEHKTTTAFQGIQSAWEQWQFKVQDTGKMVGDAFTQVLDSLAETTASFMSGEKVSWRSFALDVIKQIQQIIVKMLIMKAIQTAIGLFSGGGAAGAAGAGASTVAGAADIPVSGQFAKGGMFNRGVQMFANGAAFANHVVDMPTMFKFAEGSGKIGIMGEAGPEAIMPLTRGPDGKLGVKAHDGGGTGTTVHNFSPVVNIAVNQATDSNEAHKQAKMIQDAVDNAIANQRRQWEQDTLRSRSRITHGGV